MEYEDKGNTKWSLGANPESLTSSGREGVRWEKRYLVFGAHQKSEAILLFNSYPCSNIDLY